MATQSRQSFGCDGTEETSTYLVWNDVTVETNNFTRKKLLSGVTGYAPRGRIMAIMGPSGSGKSTLLDVLAGRLSSTVTLTGDVLISGQKRRINGKDVSYVTQQDLFLGTLSVRETLSYAAHLRLPSTTTKQEINEIIEDTIAKMGLEDCAETKIGNWHLRGISSGEKRRLSIGVEILTQPAILFLDEPTSGLDSLSSFYVVHALSSIAHEGNIVICSIHQPSLDVFNMFDDLFLLSGGQTVYFGQADMAVKFFADAGFPCPLKTSPPDHFLRCITTEFDRIFDILKGIAERKTDLPSSSYSSVNTTTAEINKKLIEKYKCSSGVSNAKEKVLELVAFNVECVVDANKVPSTSWFRQVRVLATRSFANMSRDIGYYWLRLAFYTIVSISIGTFFFELGRHEKTIVARGKCIGILYGIVVCLASGGVPFIVEEIQVSAKEILGGHYSETAFVVSNFLSSFPFILTISLSSASIVYFMVNCHQLIFSQLIYFYVNLFCLILVCEAIIMFIAALLSSALLSLGIAVGFLVFNYMASAIPRRIPNLPRIFWRYPMCYLSNMAWAIQGQLKNDLIRFKFDPSIPGHPALDGRVILQNSYGVNPNQSKWWDVAALLCLLLTYKLLFFMAIKYRRSQLSSLHRFYSKRIHQ